jgi:hypothetical protein
MVSGIVNNSRTKGVTAQNIASASRSGRQESFKKTFEPKPYWNHTYPASSRAPNSSKPRRDGGHFSFQTPVNLPHPGAGSNRHGESILIDLSNA